MATLSSKATRRPRHKTPARTHPKRLSEPEEAIPAPEAERSAPRLAVLLPLTLGALAYVRTISFDLTFLDDQLVQEQQAFLSSLASVIAAFRRLYLLGSYYRPLVTVSFVLDAQWSGTHPWGYHLTNVALHLVATGLLYALLRRLHLQLWPSVFATSLFAIHPALVESVAWIPGRNDSLFTVFALGAWVLLIADVARPSTSLRIGHVACFWSALLSKETAVVLPVVFAISIWAGAPRGTPLPPKRLWPLWVVSILGYGLVRAGVVASQGGVQATGVQTVLSHLPVLVSSLGKLLLPFRLSPLATEGDTALWPGLVAAPAVAGLVFLFRPPRPRILVLAAATFLVPLLPTLFVAERLTLENRLYLPAVGMCIFVAEIASAVSLPQPRTTAVIAGFFFATLFAVTWTYAGVYRDRDSLSEAAVSSSPGLALAHLHRGDFYYQTKHDVEDAEREYRLAIDLDAHELVVHNNLGVLLMEQKQFSEAEALFRQELALNPYYAPAHYNLGIALRNMRRVDEAAKEWERALDNDPDHINSMGELMVYHSMRGDGAKAAYYMDQMSRRGMKFLSPPSVPVSQ
jgi:hypothetical protein